MIDFNNTYYCEVHFDFVTGEITTNDVLWGKQGDTGRGIVITLFENGLMKNPTNEVVFFNATKPDGKRVWYNSETVDGKINIDFGSQLFATEGIVLAELDLVVGGKTRKSETFKIEVRKAEGNSPIDSQNYIEALVIKSPNGTAYKLTVSDAGVLTTTVL